MVDDVNMPKPDEYGSQSPIELLRQLIEYHGVYDRVKHFWKTVDRATMAACAAPPGGGRQPLSARFTRHFNVLAMPQPNQRIMTGIFTSILQVRLLLWGDEDLLCQPLCARTLLAHKLRYVSIGDVLELLVLALLHFGFSRLFAHICFDII